MKEKCAVQTSSTSFGSLTPRRDGNTEGVDKEGREGKEVWGGQAGTDV